MKPVLRAMLATITALVGGLCRMVGRTDGNVAVFFALAVVPVMIGAGMATDVARAYIVKVRLGAALDAAALAVGSETNQTTDQLTADLQHYFTANYPANYLGGDTATVNTVPANASLTATTVNFQAQATVPMVFMPLLGMLPGLQPINSITVTVSAQTQKTTGLEVAVVLDNTGSMLCGPDDGAPSYSDSTCATGVVSTDTTCTNSNNGSRICTLINASTAFVNTLTSAITSSGQLYISIVPYVTTVNVAHALGCTSGSGTCTHITSDACSLDFVEQHGYIISTPFTTSTNSVTGNTTNNGSSITNISNISKVSPYMSISGSGIPSGTFVSVVNTATNTITITKNATATHSATTLTLGTGGHTTSGSNIVGIGSPTALSVGLEINGTGIPSNTTAITSVDSATQIHMCNNATATGYTALTFGTPITYDSTANSTNPTSANWMGCVIEPTSSGENSGSTGVIASTQTDPDYSEPSGGWPSWYPFWWASGSGNSWTNGTIEAQNTTNEVQGHVVADYDQVNGPNMGCPVPLLPLTDVTSSTGKTTVLNTISSMWPRDAGGTQVHSGMIWGWRVLSPNGPFPANGTHPLDYDTAATTGWKKVVVLMTDGTEEWPETTDYTGLGALSDGKIGTTSSTSTAITNLGSRLSSLCTNMQNSGHFVIYTIGLGTDGASNTALQNCPGSTGGFFSAATTSNLQTVFNNIARALIALRLTE